MSDKFGKRLINDGDEIVGGCANAFGDRYWALVYFFGDKYNASGFYYVAWNVGGSGPWGFWYSYCNKKHVIDILIDEGWDAEEIDAVFKEYEED